MKITRDIKSIMEYSPHEVDVLIEDIGKQVKLKKDDAHNLKLMLEEAVTNAIVHGNDCNTGLVVKVAVDIAKDNTLTMTVKDEGKGFDHAAVKDPLAEEEEYKSSGRGIFLIKKLADKVSFLDEGRIIEIVKKI